MPPCIIGEGDIDDQVRSAVRCVCGDDRVMLDVRPIDQDLGRGAFPDGTKHFIVASESSTCECSSKCQWMDQVCWYRNRSVVIPMNQLQTTRLANVIQQLRGS
jgi:hypothetical protein